MVRRAGLGGGPWQTREQAQDVTGPDCLRQDGTETIGNGEADCPENCAGQRLPRLPGDRGRVEAGHRAACCLGTAAGSAVGHTLIQ